MKQKVIGFHKDQVGDWVADLECGHTQHFHHQPPWVNRPWVESKSGRDKFIGTEVECKTCEEVAMGAIRSNDEQRRIAQAVKLACLQAAIEAYEDAKMRGLCQEGAWELALDAIKSLDVEPVLRQLPG